MSDKENAENKQPMTDLDAKFKRVHLAPPGTWKESQIMHSMSL
jgi:hypothetical protein